MGIAQTGTGKTAAFSLPIVHHLADNMMHGKAVPRVLVLTPTRELAAQIDDNVKAYSKHIKARRPSSSGASASTSKWPNCAKAWTSWWPPLADSSTCATKDFCRWNGSSFWSWTRQTPCWTWASSTTSDASSPCFRTASEPVLQRTCLKALSSCPRPSSPTPSGSRWPGQQRGGDGGPTHVVREPRRQTRLVGRDAQQA